eukprot:m51a1_g8259 putative spectrin beta non-erythrocytic 5-like (536) ;mRNA; f:683-3057
MPLSHPGTLRPPLPAQGLPRATANKVAEEALLAWCRDNLPAERQVADLAESWRDGRAYCALITAFRPGLLDDDDIAGKTAQQTLAAAFTCAEERLDVFPLLDEEDIAPLLGTAVTESERRAVVLYVSEFYHLFSGGEQIVTSELASVPQSSATPEPGSWARPRTLAEREDLLVEWDSANAPLYHLETTTDPELAKPVRLVFTSFMETMLRRPWGQGKYPPLRVCEANSYAVREDKLTRIVFISEQRADGSLVALVGFSCEEHGSRAGPSERNRSYLQYLANSCLELPESRRRSPTVAEAALVCYARWLELTYRSSYLHIWVDPPDASYPEYIFRNSSRNIAVPYVSRDKAAERQKLMRTYQRIFDEWDLQSYVWRPEIPLPPSFSKDFKSVDDMEDGVNVRKELAGLVETARQLSLKLNKYFEERTLVIYLSEVTVLARDAADPERLLTKMEEETEYIIEVDVEDETPLCDTPMPEGLLSWGLIHNTDLSFYKGDDYVESTARLLRLAAEHMASGELMDRYDHQRAAGIVEAPDE